MTPILLFVAAAWSAEPDYAAECEAGNAGSCILLSIVAQRATDPVEKAKAETWFAKGAALLDRACTARDAAACAQLGEVYLVHGNPVEAQRAYEASCNLDPVACVDLADRLADRKGGAGAIPVALLQRACTHDVGLACVGAAILGEEQSLPAMDVKGWYDKGVGLLERSCASDRDKAQRARSCSTMGDLLYFGIQTTADRDKALDYWSRGCLTGEACRTQAALIYAQGDKEGSICLLRAACALGDCQHWTESCAVRVDGCCRPVE